MYKKDIEAYFRDLQDRICQGIAQADGTGSFKEDLWTRPEGGGGRTRLIQDGTILEKAGVNFSSVTGPLHPKMVTSLNVTEEVEFFATGVSIVMHPYNAWVPIIHMNVRYFELSNGQSCLSAEELYSRIKPSVISNSPNNQIPQFGIRRRRGFKILLQYLEILQPVFQ